MDRIPHITLHVDAKSIVVPKSRDINVKNSHLSNYMLADEQQDALFNAIQNEDKKRKPDVVFNGVKLHAMHLSVDGHRIDFYYCAQKRITSQAAGQARACTRQHTRARGYSMTNVALTSCVFFSPLFPSPARPPPPPVEKAFARVSSGLVTSSTGPCKCQGGCLAHGVARLQREVDNFLRGGGDTAGGGSGISGSSTSGGFLRASGPSTPTMIKHESVVAAAAAAAAVGSPFQHQQHPPSASAGSSSHGGGVVRDHMALALQYEQLGLLIDDLKRQFTRHRKELAPPQQIHTTPAGGGQKGRAASSTAAGRARTGGGATSSSSSSRKRSSTSDAVAGGASARKRARRSTASSATRRRGEDKWAETDEEEEQEEEEEPDEEEEEEEEEDEEDEDDSDADDQSMSDIVKQEPCT